jgi:predicted transcriptional regulator
MKNVIETYLENKGIRALRLAEAANVPFSIIYKWRSGAIDPMEIPLKTIVKVAKGMGIKPATLVKKILNGSE